MYNNIYEIMEHMHDVNMDVNDRLECLSLRYIEEGVGEAVSGIVNFIKKIISTFIQIVKKVISFLTFGLVFGEDTGGSSGSSGSDGKTVTTTTYSTYDKNKSYEPTTTVNGVTKTTQTNDNTSSNEQPRPRSNNNEKRVRAEYKADDTIKIFKGLVQRENIEDVFLYYFDKITRTRDLIDKNTKKYFGTLKDELNGFYDEDLDIPEDSGGDVLYQNIKKKLRITQHDMIEVKLNKDLMEDLEDFLDNEADRVADKLKQVIRTEEDHAKKIIRQVQDAELEVDTGLRVDNLKCYINRTTLLIRVIERIFKDYYRGIATVRSAYKTIERFNNN